MIAPQTIDKIRDLANIGDIVGNSVKLERRGRSLVGLCPFHKEKSPSFHVNEDRGFYHCFGCKASGDVFKFVQETEGLTFIEAVRNLGETLGIELEDDLSSEDRRKRAAEKRQELNLYEVSASAATFFEDMLRKHPTARFAHDELAKRELPYDGPAHDVLKSFRVGYAPESWDELTRHLTKSGHDLRAAESVGLIAPRRQGQGYYDRFRHRLMFAVLDLHGRIVAFSGRSLPSSKQSTEEDPAKYINSPESPIYKKRATVFGLYQARQKLRSGKPAIVVEGNFDVVSLHAREFTETVAPLGTAFTVEQGKLIRRFTNQATLLFDGDNAGRKATSASRQPARDAGLSAKVASLPDGMDPDDFARQRGADGLRNLLGAARGMLDYLIAEILNDNFAASDAEGQAKKVQEVVDLLNAEDDPNVSALAEQHADKLAGRLGVADAHTFRALKRSIKNGVRRKRELPPPEFDEGTFEPFVEFVEAPSLESRALSIERSVFGVFLDFPALLNDPEMVTGATHLEGDIVAAIACLRAALKNHLTSSPDALPENTNFHVALTRLPHHLVQFASERLAAPKHEDIDIARVELFENLDKLHGMELSRLHSGALGEMERARQEGNFDQELELLKEQEFRARTRRGL